jgi:hypothetical protein
MPLDDVDAGVSAAGLPLAEDPSGILGICMPRARVADGDGSLRAPPDGSVWRIPLQFDLDHDRRRPEHRGSATGAVRPGGGEVERVRDVHDISSEDPGSKVRLRLRAIRG